MTPIAVASSPHRRAATSVFEPAVLGVLVLIGSELMFFMGLLSAYTIARARVPMSIWPPPDQPRLPVETTAINTGVLLLSGVLVWLAVRAFEGNRGRAVKLAIAGASLGALFVALQGYEWMGLLAQGLTMQRSAHASFFYLIVGVHALHVIGGLIGHIYVVAGVARGTMGYTQLRAAHIFWAFVVIIWPVIYVMVYL